MSKLLLFAFVFSIFWLSIVNIQLVKGDLKIDYCLFEACHCELFEDDDSRENLDIVCEDNYKEFPKRVEVPKIHPIQSFQMLNQKDVKALPDDRFNGLKAESIELYDNGIETIAEGAFKGVSGVDRLDLKRNMIQDLNENTFKPIASSLKQLNLAGNKLGMADTARLTAALGQLSNLEDLDLNRNGLKSVPNLSNNKRLLVVGLQDNDISTLQPKDGETHLLPDSLKSIDLQNNRLSSIEANWFSHLKDVTTIELSKNLIATIDENAFKNLQHLKKIDLSKNEIKHIPSKLFLNLPALKTIHLGEQRSVIRKIGSYAFDKLTNDLLYETIDLTNSEIDTIEAQAFCSYQHSKAISVNRLTLKVARDVNFDQLACPLYQIESSDTKIELQGVRCGCGVNLLATKFQLIGSCLNEDGKEVPAIDYKCSNQTAKNTLCSNPIYDCSKQQKTQAPTRPSSSDSTMNGKATVRPDDREQPLTPAPKSKSSTNNVSNSSFILLLTSLSIIISNLVLNNNDRFN